MKNNMNPITDAELAELRRLHAAATPGEWRGTYYCKPDGTEIKSVDDVVETLAYSGRISPLAELFGVSIEDGKDICMTGNGPTSQANADYLAALHNAFPRLDARLEAAEREELASIVKSPEYRQMLADLVNLPARDARMKREGAAEWLETLAESCHSRLLTQYDMKYEAKRLREGGE